MTTYARMMKKTLEINVSRLSFRSSALTISGREQPRAPLIEGLLEKVEDLDGDEDVDLSDTVNVLYQTALVKSGFTIPDPNA